MSGSDPRWDEVRQEMLGRVTDPLDSLQADFEAMAEELASYATMDFDKLVTSLTDTFDDWKEQVLATLHERAS